MTYRYVVGAMNASSFRLLKEMYEMLNSCARRDRMVSELLGRVGRAPEKLFPCGHWMNLPMFLQFLDTPLMSQTDELSTEDAVQLSVWWKTVAESVADDLYAVPGSPNFFPTDFLFLETGVFLCPCRELYLELVLFLETPRTSHFLLFRPKRRPTYIARACILSLMCLDGGNSVRQVVFHSCHNCFPLEYAKCTLHGVNHWRLREKETERQWVLEKWICPWLVITKPVTSDTEKKLSRDPLHDCLLRFEAHL